MTARSKRSICQVLLLILKLFLLSVNVKVFVVELFQVKKVLLKYNDENRSNNFAVIWLFRYAILYFWYCSNFRIIYFNFSGLPISSTTVRILGVLSRLPIPKDWPQLTSKMFVKPINFRKQTFIRCSKLNFTLKYVFTKHIRLKGFDDLTYFSREHHCRSLFRARGNGTGLCHA